MKKNFTRYSLLSGFLFLCLSPLFPQDAEYYQSAFGKSDAALKSALSTIISKAGTISYDGLFDLYKTTDLREDGKIWDVYSDNTNFIIGQDECGNYKKEGDCYNREHSIPKSWFNESSPMYSDGWHVIPTDGYVNNRRSNYPFGEVASPTYTSNNQFSKLGQASNPGYSGIVFEPNDEYKGDIARILFYMATRYESRCGSWTAGVFSSSYPHLAGWVVELMLKWHRADPVSSKEIERNKAMASSKQGNRNPYIDYPELAELIFGNRKGESFGNTVDPGEDQFAVLPASSITMNSFQANWVKHPDAADYLIDVYKKEGSSTPVSLFNLDLSDGAIPTGWSKEGATYKESDGLRLATSSDGSIISPALDLSRGCDLTIAARPFGTDAAATLYITVDNATDPQATITYAQGTPKTETVRLTGTGASTIKITAKAKQRVVLFSMAATTGGVSKTSLPGYPRNTGDTESHQLSGLTPQTTYYYTVTPIINGSNGTTSDEIQVTTAIDTPVKSEWEEEVISFVSGNTLNLLNVPAGASISLYNLSGQLLMQERGIQQEESFRIEKKGIYLLHIKSRSVNIVRRIVVD